MTAELRGKTSQKISSRVQFYNNPVIILLQAVFHFRQEDSLSGTTYTGDHKDLLIDGIGTKSIQNGIDLNGTGNIFKRTLPEGQGKGIRHVVTCFYSCLLFLHSFTVVYCFEDILQLFTVFVNLKAISL